VHACMRNQFFTSKSNMLPAFKEKVPCSIYNKVGQPHPKQIRERDNDKEWFYGTTNEYTRRYTQCRNEAQEKVQYTAHRGEEKEHIVVDGVRIDPPNKRGVQRGSAPLPAQRAARQYFADGDGCRKRRPESGGRAGAARAVSLSRSLSRGWNYRPPG
jgi:hypothetical protein